MHKLYSRFHRSLSIVVALFLLLNFSTIATADGYSAIMVTDNIHPDLVLTEGEFSKIFAGDPDTFGPNPETGAADFDFEKAHKYLGYSTILMAGLAAITSSNKSLHYGAAYTATGTALATCFTGYYEYRDRFDLEEGFFAEDNVHIMLGALGTIAIATAVAIADSGEEKSHAGMGITGGSAMVISVIVIKW
jgi:hypothetical protein